MGQDQAGDDAIVEALGGNVTYTRRHPRWPTGIVDVTLGDQGYPSLGGTGNLGVSGLSAADAAASVRNTTADVHDARAARRALIGIPLFYDVNLRPALEDLPTAEELLSARLPS